MNKILLIILKILISLFVLWILFYLWWKLYFLRNPKRKIPSEEGILSPADGKVLKIMKITSKKPITINKKYWGKIRTLTADIGNETWLVSIFMSPMDVHYNRIPFDGKIVSQKHYNGMFYNASHFFDTLFNEKNEIILEDLKDKKYKIKVIQIAGLIARRIESFVSKGDVLKRGQVYGRINMGSQVTLIMPNNTKIFVREGQKVKAGETIIAKKL